ncbi:MAG: hypothetical protein HGB10_11735 [Coriobacteriia bacterium]|nr:hypothetical protein [Coriobacteriia bacterium]
MEDRGQQTDAPRGGLPKATPTRFDVVFWIAFGVSTLLVAGQVGFILSFTPVVLRMAATQGGALPTGLRLASDFGPIGLFLLFTIGDALIFALFAWFARRYWIGLLFVPSILYLAGGFGALWVFAAEVALGR